MLHQSQSQVASDKHRFRVLCCGRRWGKTTLAIEEMKACAAYREARVAYIAPTFQQARDIAWAQLKRECKDAAISINESRLEIRLANVHGTESLIILRGWESIETLRGQLFDLIVIDEVASMRNFWSAWEEVVRPTLTDRKGEALFISTPKGFNHFHELYCVDPKQGKAFRDQKQDDEFKSFNFTSYDNPFIPKDELDKARQQLTEDRFAQEYMADFRKMEGLVYKEFDRAKHVLDMAAIEDRVGVANGGLLWKGKLIGIDFGYTNPAVVLTIGRDATDAFYVTDEFYERGKTDQEVVDYAAALKATRAYPDPEAAGAVELLRRAKVHVRDVVKGKDSVKNGISVVRELFKNDKLFIASHLANTIWELETYAYPDKKQDHNEYEDPIKENDHAMDAMRYVLMMENKASAVSTSVTRYSTSAAPLPQGPMPPPSGSQRPKTAHTFIPKLK